MEREIYSKLQKVKENFDFIISSITPMITQFKTVHNKTPSLKNKKDCHKRLIDYVLGVS